ncbi:hypothetical protein [Staphylococcus sp.]|uniref:hypothetical protein n=1 Tax=Staphylococcus sp. TaxID=29387 RepID=UPI000ECEAA85|nr:hypothetical protein [Staphylococcus sp.]HBY82671.1 hypothetical protein [Staphylococcus sp.]
MEEEIKNENFHVFSKRYLIISLILNVIIFIIVLIWIIKNMIGIANMEIDKLLETKTFIKLSLIITIGTFIFGSISPIIYSLYTSPLDNRSNYSAKSDWERENRNDYKDVLMLLPYTFFLIHLICFLIFFAYTTITQIFNFIMVVSVLLFITLYFIYKVVIFFGKFFKKLLK